MVATVASLTSASSTVHYFRAESGLRREDAGDYYSSREQRKGSHWRGAGAAALGLSGHVEPEEFRRVLEGYVPGTEVRLGRLRDGAHEHRPGIDITLSAPKSVSLEALLPGRGNARAMRAHDAAVRATLAFIETRLLETRRWDPEQRRSVRIPADGLVAATFRHITSRNNDPQLHTHCVIANMSRGTDGNWRSVELGLLRRHEKLIGAFYRNELARGLRKAGFALRPSMIGNVPGFEIRGWSQAVLDAFSSRRREILDFIAKRGWRYSAQTAQLANLSTRQRKNEPARAALEEMWSAYAEEHGLAKTRERPQQRLEPPSALEIVWEAVEHLAERSSVFAERDLVARALTRTPGVYSLDDIERAIRELARDGHIVAAARGQSWVTKSALVSEREILSRMREGRGTAEPLLDEAKIAAGLGGLTAAQQEAATTILASRDRVVGVQGYAGTGKTTMLRTVVELSGARRVLGLAPSASAARTLSREANLPCRTLQWFLARYRDVADNVADEETLADLRDRFEGSVVVVDEMSLAGTRQTRELMRIADRLGVARLVLVGDSRQLRSVEAGQPFRLLQEAGMATALMDDIRRQRNPDLKAAVLDMIAGEPGTAVARVRDNLHEAPLEELGEMAARLWLRLSPEAREETLLLAPTRAMRSEINRMVREGLEAEGVIRGPSLRLRTLVSLRLTASERGDPGNWREGDVVLFHRDLYHYRIAAGDACRVTAIDDGRAELDHPDGRPRHLQTSGDIRYRFDLCEEVEITLRAGDRIRWTRNDRERELVNGGQAEVAAIDDNVVHLVLDDGRRLALARDDPQLRFVDHAWASTVHAAQGLTRDNVIAVLDSGHGLLTNQQTFYVELSRARDNAVVLTDNREQLVATLEENTGEQLTAIEAVRSATPEKPRVQGQAVAEVFDDLRREKTEREKLKRATEIEEERRRITAWLEEIRRVIAVHGQLMAMDGDRAPDEQGLRTERAQLDLEKLIGEGRIVVSAALGRTGASPETAEAVREALAEAGGLLEKIASRAAERSALARLQDWREEWQAASREKDTTAITEAVRQAGVIAGDPALPEPERDELRDEIRRHEQQKEQEEADRIAGAWLASWNGFIEDIPDLSASAEAATRISRGRQLLAKPGLDADLSREIRRVIDSYEQFRENRLPATRYSRTEMENRHRRLEAREAAHDARKQSVELRDALGSVPRLRDEAGYLPRETTISQVLAESEKLTGEASRIADGLSTPEHARLAAAVNEARGRLGDWLFEMRRKLGDTWERAERAWVELRHQSLTSDWNRYTNSEAFRPDDIESHRHWLDPMREISRDPRLDAQRRDRLQAFLHRYDSEGPRQRRLRDETLAIWASIEAGTGPWDDELRDRAWADLKEIRAFGLLSAEQRREVDRLLDRWNPDRRRAYEETRSISESRSISM